MPPRPSLAAIITSARAGSLDFAWRMFAAGGYAARHGDPAALAVEGRLLKDRALRAPPEVRLAALAAAADAYAAADSLLPQPYTKINVATLRRLAGDAAGARRQAAALLAWMAEREDIPETPYFLAATRAEAHLLLGETAAAQAALAEAVRHSPDGWADRATTLRQLSLILAATGDDAGWLDGFRPPRTLCFAGHLGLAEDDHARVSARIDAVLAAESIGFGYGALAAGGDILVAEALLRAGAELHVLLPVSRGSFAAQSVAPYAPGWRARFEACLAAAASVSELTSFADAYEPLTTQLGSEVTMGAAVLYAAQLETQAVQLLVIDDGDGPFGAGRHTALQGERWRRRGLAQHLIVAPRSAPVLASATRVGREGRGDLELRAMIHVSLAGHAADDGAFAHAVDDMLAPLGRAAARIAPRPLDVIPCGNGWIARFADPAAALAHAQALQAAAPEPSALRIAGHYGVTHALPAPAMPVGRAIDDLQVIAEAAMPGALTVSETFATALYIDAAGPPAIERIGEAGEARLFAVIDRDLSRSAPPADGAPRPPAGAARGGRSRV
ncbi:MAG: hypothetical protein ABSD80_17095 [Caulobacteraceae bacterium]